ncbi:hypothetical protein E3N88_07143 [Mikania micrantha]|uniref:Uncharacterized protein n=1 Tax=Mikania micrantha TaxID=192012 RepID=A0A5N6PST1_9ASTR|nr:hypothetical protein E3N88_07143 [Mikania micrantha]
MIIINDDGLLDVITDIGKDIMMVYPRGGGTVAEAIATDLYIYPIHKPSSVYHDYISVEALVRRIRGFWGWNGKELGVGYGLVTKHNQGHMVMVYRNSGGTVAG